MLHSSNSLVPLAPSYPYPFPPPSATKRANTLLLKHALVDLLPPAEGQAYWQLLCELVTGRITKDEFDLGWASSLSGTLRDEDAANRLEVLHNSLLLSILYNTTKTTLPPTSVSHQGWTSKRKRGEAALLAEGGADPLGELSRKRRKLKKLTGGMTKAEKKRLKLLLGVGPADKEKDKAAPGPSTGRGQQTQQQAKPGLLMPPSAGLKTPSSAAFQQELQRVTALPSMYESKEVYDVNTMRDRMTGIAFSNGASGGVDGEAAGMACLALDMYLKDLLTELLSVTTESAGLANPEDATHVGMAKPRRKRKVTRQHMAALIELRPGLFHSAQLSSVERFVSLEACEYTQSRDARLARLESAKQEKEAARAEERRIRKLKKEEGFVIAQGATSTDAVVKIEIEEQDGGTQSSGHATSTASGGQQGAAGAANGMQTLPSEDALQAELFPELPVTPVDTAKDNATKAQDPVRTKLKPGILDGGAASSTEEEDANEASEDESTDAKEDAKRKEKEKSKKMDKGRLGVWKLLNSILASAGNGSARSLL